jgi:hypothetical protein
MEKLASSRKPFASRKTLCPAQQAHHFHVWSKRPSLYRRGVPTGAAPCLGGKTLAALLPPTPDHVPPAHRRHARQEPVLTLALDC